MSEPSCEDPLDTVIALDQAPNHSARPCDIHYRPSSSQFFHSKGCATLAAAALFLRRTTNERAQSQCVAFITAKCVNAAQ